jgi:hypothetical protein
MGAVRVSLWQGRQMRKGSSAGVGDDGMGMGLDMMIIQVLTNLPSPPPMRCGNLSWSFLAGSSGQAKCMLRKLRVISGGSGYDSGFPPSVLPSRQKHSAHGSARPVAQSCHSQITKILHGRFKGTEQCYNSGHRRRYQEVVRTRTRSWAVVTKNSSKSA